MDDIIMSVSNIKKTYKTGTVKVEALKECSISLKRGEFTAIIGKSGSGKSTLLRILGTLDRPDTGSITIDGNDVLKMKDKQLSKFRREKIGFIYQDYSLFPEYTGYENIIMPVLLDKQRPDKEKVMKLLEELGIDYCSHKFPSEMSGGEQQRVAIARALITEPSIIFADEPTGNLDAENANELALMLRRASDEYNQTIVMVTHDRQLADYTDKIIEITNGVIKSDRVAI